jgi:sporulation protein YlmC with PRC-barrel domain
MKRSTILSTVALFSSLGISTPMLAAEPPATDHSTSGSASKPEAVKPGEACLAAVRAFTADMSKQGYWLGGSDYGYGYGMGGYGYDYGMMTAGRPIGATNGYATARPGYEIRTLIASANILAQTGNKQACESTLHSAHALYTNYAADLHSRGFSWADQPDWRQRQIAAAQSVTGKDVSVRSDQLLDADVVNPGNDSLGSVHDLVSNPQTGKIAYVIISRGGLFGIDASYTPVPWSDFKAAPSGSLLVLDTTKTVLADAPQARDAQFTKAGQFEAESQKVEAYWTAHVKLASAQ